MSAAIRRIQRCADGVSPTCSARASRARTPDRRRRRQLDAIALHREPKTSLRWLWLSLAIIIADQATKHAMLATFRPGEELPLTPLASLVLAFNRGAAFSFLAGEDGWQRWLFAAIAVAACAAMAWLLRRGGSGLFCAGLALIIGGALGNLYDRLTLGHVVDFLLVHYQRWYFPAFNVADSAITIGAAALIIDSFRERRPVPKER